MVQSSTKAKCFVNWNGTIFAPLFPRILTWSARFCGIYTPQLWVAILVTKSCTIYVKGVSTGPICDQIVTNYAKTALFASKARFPLWNLLACCNHCRLQHAILRVCPWTLWHTFRNRMDVMLFLASLIDFRSTANSYRFVQIIMLHKSHRSSLISGFVSLACLKLLLVIEIRNSLHSFGKICSNYCNARPQCLLLTILKLMVKQKDFTAQLSRCCDAIAIISKIAGPLICSSVHFR